MKKPKKPIVIRKIARLRDKATGDYLEIIEFPISQTEKSRLELPPSVVVDLSAFERRLRDAGAILPKANTREFLRSAAHRKAPLDFVYEDKTGWTEDRKLFVLNDGVIGKSKQRILGVNQGRASADASGRLSVAGDWKKWRSTVGKAAGLSSILMCSVCTAFAAPLLELAGCQSFMICIVGPSRSGKSIATLAAGSVIGVGQASDLVTWNITDARLEQRLSGFNDCLFPIDDLMALRAQNDRDRYLRIQGIAYKLAQGWATGRHDSFTQRRIGSWTGWRTIALTSNEVSIRDLARKVGLERQRGEAIRLIDLPAFGDGQDHIFDRTSPKLQTADMAEWKRQRFSEVAAACETNHGAAYRRYVTSLIEMGPELSPLVKDQVSCFLRKVRDDHDTDLSRDIANRFAVLYCGGILAIRAGLVEWTSHELLAALSSCYVRARCMLPDDGELLRRGLEALEQKLAVLPALSDEHSRSNEAADSHIGVRVALSGRGRAIWIPDMTKYVPFRRLLLAMALSICALPAQALTADEINRATFAAAGAPVAADDAKSDTKPAAKKAPDPRVIKAQVLLDRQRLSPGVIDGFDGGNVRKAMAELRRREHRPEAGALDAVVWAALNGDATTDIITEYTVTAEDAAYPFAPTPKDYAELAELKMIGYRTAAEMIGERFHMDEELVRALNPTIENWKEGDRLTVTNVTTIMGSLTGNKAKSDRHVGRILVERGRGAVTAFDEQDQVLAIYPATVGSADTPTPAGNYTVKGVAHEPTYSYRPDINFKQGDNNEKLTLPAGPNGPVGSVWIALSKPTYGIHGTPEPSAVSKTASHGCVRLTNWDSEDLASMVRPGVKVDFVD